MMSDQDASDNTYYGAGDTFLILNVLPPELADTALDALQKEVDWKTMAHRGGDIPRLISVQGDIEDDGSVPLYRHPADDPPPLVPFTPTAVQIRDIVEKRLRDLGIVQEVNEDPAENIQRGVDQKRKHILNHALVQLYRDGKDYISDHADKTIDVVRGIPIISVSLGAQRTFTLRQKKGLSSTDEDEGNTEEHTSPAPGHGTTAQRKHPKRPLHRIPLPHNSALVLGARTNRGWLHSIRPDRRPESILPAEVSGPRASLTFRAIGTFLTPVGHGADANELSGEVRANDLKETVEEGEAKKWVIWGQGAVGKTRMSARLVTQGGSEADRLLTAFGEENRNPEFEWESAYGEGFDVVKF